jgi:hypothetical protein
LGEQTVKNIARPIGVHRVQIAAPELPAARGAAPAAQAVAAASERPSIAVLPFQNMSGDPEQDYFIDGIVEDIITALSRNHALLVIARNSTFTYKGRAADVKSGGVRLAGRSIAPLSSSIRYDSSSEPRQTISLSGFVTDSGADTDCNLGVERPVQIVPDAAQRRSSRVSNLVAARRPASSSK